METENIYRQELISKYRQSLGQIFRYLPWLKEKSGNDMTKHYQGADMPKKSIVIPVYDSTLLGFVKETFIHFLGTGSGQSRTSCGSLTGQNLKT